MNEEIEMTEEFKQGIVALKAIARELGDLVGATEENTECRIFSWARADESPFPDELEGLQENISFSPEDTYAYMCDACGCDFRYDRGLSPCYCPNCGRRNVI
ncbi:hypothetical protein K6V98_08235 [Collinsella sp. AGMB00827]|uniref:Hydrogenase maturation nickel metallochaperone HypA n=1 Tax=Collinsella ureilytica TaxID=2869515 RepID=A0ABS7MM25_9ACTN|nr:hypothetical protein [Collinsella urealyticum]MBY4798332.1 hypothetical protein [Collinsella urealyticum]